MAAPSAFHGTIAPLWLGLLGSEYLVLFEGSLLEGAARGGLARVGGTLARGLSQVLAVVGIRDLV